MKPSSILRRSCCLLIALFCIVGTQDASAILRDCWYGQFDPANMGKGGWLYIMSRATNHLDGNVASVTNENSLFAYMRSQGMSHVIVKAGTSNMLWTGSGNVSTNNTAAAQFNSKLVKAAHDNGLLIFGSNRSWGADMDGENNVARYVFSVGADGFIWDAESEWETSTSRPWLTNAWAQAWYMCGGLRSVFPTKFLAHNPYDTLYLHSSFPFKEFGYFCDVVIPQVYHHSASEGSASAAINWTDVNYRKWQESLVGTSSNINGQTIYWTNSIKPIFYMREIYNGTSGTTATPPEDISEFVDYMQADPHCPSITGFGSANWFRSELYSPAQWAVLKGCTIGDFSNVVNNIVIDDASATYVGEWTVVRTIACTTSAVNFYDEDGVNINTYKTNFHSFGTNYWKKASGTGAAYFEFTPNVITAGDYNIYQWHPTRSDGSAGVPIIINHAAGTATVNADQRTNGGTWSFVGRFPFAAGPTTIRISDATTDGNLAQVDGLKMTYVYPTGVPTAPGNLVATAVSSSQIDLRWKDNSTNETGFWIAKSTTSGGPYTNVAFVGLNTTNYSCTGLAANTTYYFVVRGTNYLGYSSNSAQASAKTGTGVPVPPSIVTQPQSQSVLLGGEASFTVVATGTDPLSYQWRWNGTNMARATNSTYAITNVQLAQAGSYSVVVSNGQGTVISSNAVLTVTVIVPSITSQPQSQTVEIGGGATFNVVATGTEPLSYQWRYNGTNIPSATESQYSKANIQVGEAGSYSVLVSSPYGNVTSSNAVLTVHFSAPAISSQPQSQTVAAGQTAVFGVVATGTAPLSYQWRFSGTNLVGATAAGLTLTNVWSGQAGSYSVVISSPYGSVTSSNATLSVSSVFKAGGWSKLWSLGGGARPYLAASGHTERGMAYNAVRNHVLVLTTVGAKIYALDGDTGADLHTMSTPTNVISGGYFPLLMIGAAEDGAIYAGNLVLTAGASAPFRLYRWANDDPATVPTLAYSGDPVSGSSERWGDTLEVRGSGTNTQILIGSRNGTNVVVFSTTNGTTFVPQRVSTPNVAGGNFGLGLTFGEGNTFWGKASQLPLRQVGFALGSTVGTNLRSYTNNFPTNIAPIGVSVSMKIVAGIGMGSPDSLSLFDLSATNTAPTLLASTNFVTSNTNTMRVGAVDCGNNRVYALDPNNGILAMQITPATLAPSIAAEPQDQVVDQGASAVFFVGVNGTAPFAYQWRLNGTNIAAATESALSITNALPEHAGSYSVVVSNGVGSATSSSAMLSVNPPPTPPQFSSVTLLPSGEVQVVVNGTVGSAMIVDRSTNLTDWEVLTNLVNKGGSINLSEPATNQQTFYRVRQ